MKRVAVAGMCHETNSYGPRPATLDAFSEFELFSGRQLIDYHRGTRSVVAGFLAEADARGWAVLPTFSAQAWPCAPAAADVAAELLRRLRVELTSAGEVDAVLLNLHGAMVAEGHPDMECDTLRAVREVVGPDVPVGAVVDLHANPTAEFVAQCDVVVAYDTYPHVDMWERGVEVASLIGEAMAGRRLRTVLRKSPLETVPAAQATATEPMSGLLVRAQARARRVGIARISICAGFPYVDVERTGTAVLVVADQHAEETATAIAAETVADIESCADDFRIERPSVDEAVDLALAEHVARPVVIADLADNIGGGSAGDGTALLAALLERGATGIVATIADPSAVAVAAQAGAGATIQTDLGGKFDDLHGLPLDIVAKVITLTDGRYTTAGTWMTGQTFDLGACAVLEVGAAQATVLVTTRAVPPFHREQLTHAGIDPAQASVIVAKGAVAWRSAFGDDAATVIEADTPGACPLDLTSLRGARASRDGSHGEGPCFTNS